jgi:hypothetical protein
MATATGTYRKGKIFLNGPVDWPEGTAVEIATAPTTRVGLTEEEWPTTPEGIAELLERIAHLEPLEFTPEEEAEMQIWRSKLKQYGINKMRQRWQNDK